MRDLRGTTRDAALNGKLNKNSVIRLDGIGPVRLGMTIEEATQVADRGANSSHPPPCPALVYPDRGALVTLTASGGDRIDLVSLAAGELRTEAGSSVGSSVGSRSLGRQPQRLGSRDPGPAHDVAAHGAPAGR